MFFLHMVLPECELEQEGFNQTAFIFQMSYLIQYQAVIVETPWWAVVNLVVKDLFVGILIPFFGPAQEAAFFGVSRKIVFLSVTIQWHPVTLKAEHVLQIKETASCKPSICKRFCLCLFLPVCQYLRDSPA